jgi:hypothetical protein
MCMNVNNTPWKDKKAQVYFRGAITNTTYDEDGKFINRLKLMHIAHDNPDLFEYGHTYVYSNMTDEQSKRDIPEKFTSGLQYHEELCTRMDFKYLIHIDGELSSWGRGPAILYSDSVLLEVQSVNEPLYIQSFIPWVHYVPIKNDLSDLL